VAFVLPVIMIVFAVYLARHPSTTRDNSRIGIGLFLLLMVASGFFHLFSAQPQPTDGVVALSQAGGLLGWLIAIPFLSTISIWGAVPVLVYLVRPLSEKAKKMTNWKFTTHLMALRHLGGEGLKKMTTPTTLPWWKTPI
jgi:S-DNA-T family DNA segregation ATPase FtsK/SpoIIIE